jgi:hypothetical protein
MFFKVLPIQVRPGSNQDPAITHLSVAPSTLGEPELGDDQVFGRADPHAAEGGVVELNSSREGGLAPPFRSTR